MISLIDYILSIIAILFSAIFLILPLKAGLFIARFVGMAGYYLNRKRRRVAHANMKAAFKESLAFEELDRIIKGMYKNFGQVILEVFTLPRVNKKYIEKFIKVENFERISESLSRGKGVIFLTAHFGNWELTSIVSALKGHPLSVLAREQKMKRLNGLLNYYREMKGCKVVKKGMSTREIFKDLKDNKLIGVLSDQDAGRRGVFVDFFGRKTSFAPGVVNLAESSGAVILPTFIVRNKGPYQTIYIEKPLDIVKTGKRFEDEKINLQKYADILESYIRKFPDQWLWVHKRWKSTPQKTVLVLNDGKQGHLNQSKSVVEKILKLRLERGYQSSDTKVEIINISYRDSFRKKIFLALSLLPFVKNSRGLVKFALSDESYKKLTTLYGDIIVSAGSSLVPLNVFAKFDNNARNIAIMDPGLLYRKLFNLCIIPGHDNVKKSHNIVLTKGSPNLINQDILDKSSEEILKISSFGKGPKIGLIIGGSNENFVLEEKTIDLILDEIIELSKKIDAEILVTTSRRTSPKIEKLLKEKLKDISICNVLVIANEKNYAFALPGIMGLADILIVSGDSSSMVSEAASSGKKVIVFEPKIIKENNKHLRMLKILNNEGFISLVKADQIKNSLLKLLEENAPAKILDDNCVVSKAVERFV